MAFKHFTPFSDLSFSFYSFHVHLWTTYTVLFVFLTLLIPCLWVSYIWDQIIDPHYESDNIAIPDHRLLKLFYFASRKITSNFWWRTPIFFIIAALFVTASVLDVVGFRAHHATLLLQL